MTTSNIAILDRPSTYRVREDRSEYDVEADAAAADLARQLHKAQGLVGEALNLVGLLLAALENQGDRRAMQIHTGVQLIEKKLQKAYNRLDEYEIRHTKLFPAYGELDEL